MHLPTPCWVVSDLHLGAAPAERERDFLALVDAATRHAKSLVVNGDLFEFWFEWRHVIPRVGYRAVAALAAAHDAGLKLLFVGGNHDCWGGDALEHAVGGAYHLGRWDGTIGAWRTRIDHGDGLREREDRRYRGLRTVLRHPLSKWAYRLLHPDIGMWLAFRSSHTSRATRPRDGGAGLRSVAQNVLAERRDLDLVVLGHSHVRTLERVPTGGVFANPGCWLDLPAFLAIDDATIELREWNGSAEGHRLDALDRGAKKALTNA